jgi:hypothetical protein
VLAKIGRGAAGLHADLELLGADGAVIGTRQLSAAQQDCRELGSAMALAISVAIDPLSLTHSAPPRASVEAPTVVTPARAVTMPAPVEVLAAREPKPIRWSAGASVLSSLGANPSLDAGFATQIGARIGIASLAVEGRLDLPASTSVAIGGVRTTLAFAALVPCVHIGLARGCAIGAIGALYGSGYGIDMPFHRHTFYAAAGGRVGAELPLSRRLALDLHLDLLGTLTSTRLEVDHTTVWTTPPISAALALGIAATFL